ncbi:MAG: hypothetical protein WCO02_05560 [Bacteroidota bacterium]
MKTLINLILIMVCLVPESFSQVDKTQMSLDVSKKYAQNIGLLSQLTWKRKTEGYVGGNLATMSVSSVTLGPDGKMQAIVISQQSYTEKKRGIRGAIQAGVVSDINAYVKSAVELVGKYIFLSQGQMVDLFNKGTLSILGSSLQAEGFNLLVQGDHLNYKFDQSTLLYQSQDISTVLGGEAVTAKVQYETSNGVNRVTSVTINMAGPKVTIKLVNFEWAKKI